MDQKSTQDYLKAIYSIAKNGDLVSNNEISQKLDVAPASVTEMLKKLSEEGYIKYSPYHGSTLSEKGLQKAQKIARKHRLLEKWLSDVGADEHISLPKLEDAVKKEFNCNDDRFVQAQIKLMQTESRIRVQSKVKVWINQSNAPLVGTQGPRHSK